MTVLRITNASRSRSCAREELLFNAWAEPPSRSTVVELASEPSLPEGKVYASDIGLFLSPPVSPQGVGESYDLRFAVAQKHVFLGSTLALNLGT